MAAARGVCEAVAAIVLLQGCVGGPGSAVSQSLQLRLHAALEPDAGLRIVHLRSRDVLVAQGPPRVPMLYTVTETSCHMVIVDNDYHLHLHVHVYHHINGYSLKNPQQVATWIQNLALLTGRRNLHVVSSIRRTIIPHKAV